MLRSLVAAARADPGRAKAILTALLLILVVLAATVRTVLSRSRGSADSKRIKRDTSGRSSSSDKRSPSSSSSKKKSKSSRSSSSKGRNKIDSSLPTLTVLVGAHGSGKSAWVAQYVDKVRKSALVISSDTVRASVTGSIDDYSREDAVAEKVLDDVRSQLLLRRTVIVDDCRHNMRPAFRAKLLELAPEGEYNRVIRRFPIKLIFARSRIDKDLADGKTRHDPTVTELEAQIAQLDSMDDAIKVEGWYEES